MRKEIPPSNPPEFSAYAITSYNIHDRSQGTITSGEKGAFAGTPEEAINTLREELGPEYEGLEFKTVPVKEVYLRGRFFRP